MDNGFIFATQQALSGTSDVVSTNVHRTRTADGDLGAGILFPGLDDNGWIVIEATDLGGVENATLRARFVAADNAALTSNPIILGDTGVSPVLAVADLPRGWYLSISMQRTAKEFYGVIFLQGGTSPVTVVNAYFSHSRPTNLRH